MNILGKIGNHILNFVASLNEDADYMPCYREEELKYKKILKEMVDSQKEKVYNNEIKITKGLRKNYVTYVNSHGRDAFLSMCELNVNTTKFVKKEDVIFLVCNVFLNNSLHLLREPEFCLFLNTAYYLFDLDCRKERVCKMAKSIYDYAASLPHNKMPRFLEIMRQDEECALLFETVVKHISHNKYYSLKKTTNLKRFVFNDYNTHSLNHFFLFCNVKVFEFRNIFFTRTMLELFRPCETELMVFVGCKIVEKSFSVNSRTKRLFLIKSNTMLSALYLDAPVVCVSDDYVRKEECYKFDGIRKEKCYSKKIKVADEKVLIHAVKRNRQDTIPFYVLSLEDGEATERKACANVLSILCARHSSIRILILDCDRPVIQKEHARISETKICAMLLRVRSAQEYLNEQLPIKNLRILSIRCDELDKNTLYCILNNYKTLRYLRLSTLKEIRFEELKEVQECSSELECLNIEARSLKSSFARVAEEAFPDLKILIVNVLCSLSSETGSSSDRTEGTEECTKAFLESYVPLIHRLNIVFTNLDTATVEKSRYWRLDEQDYVLSTSDVASFIEKFYYLKLNLVRILRKSFKDVESDVFEKMIEEVSVHENDDLILNKLNCASIMKTKDVDDGFRDRKDLVYFVLSNNLSSQKNEEFRRILNEFISHYCNTTLQEE